MTSPFSLLRVLDRWLIDDAFACRIGRGRQAAVDRAMDFCHTHPWCLKLDIRKYFDSIDHNRLLELLTRRFKDVPLHTLFDRIVRSYRGSQGIGLPIGSLMSQHFANFYLGWLDRYVKEALQVRGYVRYMDDMLLWGKIDGSCNDSGESARFLCAMNWDWNSNLHRFDVSSTESVFWVVDYFLRMSN